MKKEDLFIKRIGLRLKEVRQAKGWTLEETEGRGFPSWRHLQKIEAGKNFTFATFYKICQVYNMSPAEIFQGIR